MMVEGQSKRQDKRDSLFLSAAVHIEGDDERFDVRVRNLSPGGMMIDGALRLQPGVRIIVQIRGIDDVSGRIAWAAAGRAGVAFDQDIDPQQARTSALAKTKTELPEYLQYTPGRRPGLAIR